MSSETIGLYLTRSGKEAIRLKRNSIGTSISYSWIGEYGAGSGATLDSYLAMIDKFKKTKRGLQTSIDAHVHQKEVEHHE